MTVGRTPNRNTKNLVLRVCVFQNMHDLVSSCCSFAEIGQEMYQDLSKQCRANSVWSFKLFFGDILVHIVIIVCLSSLIPVRESSLALARVNMSLFEPCLKIYSLVHVPYGFSENVKRASTPSSLSYGITAHVWTLSNLELRTTLYSPRVD